MAKTYTDIEQSEKLVEILPIESADMCYPVSYNTSGGVCGIEDVPIVSDYADVNQGEIPCWSLAALLEIINKCCRYGVRLKFLRNTFDSFGNVLKNVWCITTDTSETEPFIDVVYADNALDAAVNVAIKLHEQKLI